MNHLTKKIAILTIFGVFVFAQLPLQAQEWSDAQKQVWNNVETYWALDAKGDTEAFMSYFHADYVGWTTGDATPTNKESAAKFIAHGHKTSKTLVQDLQPLSISIHGDIAIVHYYYSQVKESDGKEKNVAGRWTDIVKKQGDKWVLIGDHGGNTSKN